jgi:hypothetical protein
MDHEKELLDLFKSKDINPRLFATRPYSDSGSVYATDLYSAVRIESSLCDEKYKPQAKGPYIKHEGEYYLLKLSDIQSALKWHGLYDIKAEKTIEETCQECEGKGSVAWTYHGADKDWHRKFDCPVCHGAGYKTYKLEFNTGEKGYSDDFSASFQLHDGEYCISLYYLGLLEKAMKLLGKDHVLMGNTDKDSLHFVLDKGIDIFIAMYTPYDDEKTVISVEKIKGRTNSLIN